MKKILLLIVFIFSNYMNGQVYVNQNFNQEEYPTGWNIQDFYLDNSYNCDQTYGLVTNLYYEGTPASIQTPNYVAGSNGTLTTFSFEYKIFPYYEDEELGDFGTIDLKYSIDNGVNWVTISTINSNNYIESEDCQLYTTSIAAGIIPLGSDVKFMIEATYEDGDYFINIDNLSIYQVLSSAPSCSTSHSATQIDGCGNYNINLSWNATSGSSGYKLSIGNTPGSYNIMTDTVVNDNNFTIEASETNTNYYWKVVPFNAIGDAIGCIENLYTTTNLNCYCSAEIQPDFFGPNNFENFSTSGGQQNISNFEPQPTDVFYNDFTNMIVSGFPGDIINFNVTSEVSWWQYTAIWIDFNNDYQFSANEQIFGSELTDGSFEIPESQSAGEYRIRVRLGIYNSDVDPCGDLFYSYTHDYTLEVLPIEGCGFISNLQTLVVGNESASISWNVPVTGVPDNGYQYYLSTSSDLPTEQTQETGSAVSNELELSDLDMGQTYYLWVRAVCSTSVLSTWKGITFTTGQVTVPINNPEHSTQYISYFELSTSSISQCPVSFSYAVPVGFQISGLQIKYNMTSLLYAFMSEQMSLLKCTTNGNTESQISEGVGSSTGTMIYNRSGLNIANGLTGTVNFQLHAWRTYGGDECSVEYAKVDANTVILVVTLERIPCVVPTNPIISDQVFCVGSLVSDILVDGIQTSNAYNIYENETDLIPLLDNIELETGIYYVSQQIFDGCESEKIPFNIEINQAPEAPIVNSPITLVEGDTLNDIEVNVGDSEQIRWYASETSNQVLPANTILESTTYYVSAFLGCESVRIPVEVNLIERIADPIVDTTQELCGVYTLNDIEVTVLSGASVLWFDSETSVQELNTTNPISSGIYYVAQTDGITTSNRIALNISIAQTPESLVSQNLLFCGNRSFGSIQVNNAQGTVVKWYSSLTSTQVLSNSANATSGTYYVTQSIGVCESERTAIVVEQIPSLEKPLAQTQTFCGGGLVSDLVAEGISGSQLSWFNSANSSAPLSGSTALITGTYYVSQSINGCTSDKRAVAVRVVNLTAPIVSPFVICGSGTISDLFIPAASGVTFNWYNSPTSTSLLDQNTVLNSGTYFVSKVHYGCESQRTAVSVTIGSIPNAPTGISVQSFEEGSTISDLILNQQNVTWYISYNDSQTGTNALALNMPLVNGQTYYAVIIGNNGCPSLPFEVTVDVYLSNDSFEMNELKYYPNPVSDILSIDYSENIIQIEVFDLLGKRVKQQSTNDKNVSINLSDLASGTYMILLNTETKAQFIKVIKK